MWWSVCSLSAITPGHNYLNHNFIIISTTTTNIITTTTIKTTTIKTNTTNTITTNIITTITPTAMVLFVIVTATTLWGLFAGGGVDNLYLCNRVFVFVCLYLCMCICVFVYLYLCHHAGACLQEEGWIIGLCLSPNCFTAETFYTAKARTNLFYFFS